MVILAIGIGNLDMHTKYIGLVHTKDGAVTLAPAYDAVPQAHMQNDGMLALAVNKEYRHSEITRDDLRTEFSGWGLRNAARTVNDTLEELQSIVKEESELDGAALALQDRVAVFDCMRWRIEQAELDVQCCRRLERALVQAMRLVHDEQVEVERRLAHVERRQHHRRVESGGLAKDVLRSDCCGMTKPMRRSWRSIQCSSVKTARKKYGPPRRAILCYFEIRMVPNPMGARGLRSTGNDV